MPQVSSMSMLVVGSTLAFLWTLPSAFAQTTNATCLAVYQWTSNSHKQSPCQVASSLLAVCTNGSYNVAALPDQTHYLGPDLSDANPCQCNTVVYSLMSACGACQLRTTISWSSWSANCAMVSINSYPFPIPSGTYVPGWAYFDVEPNDAFDISQAKDNANKTESTATPQPTRAASSSSIPRSSSQTTVTSSIATASTTAIASAETSESEDRANSIGGGIVGGVLGVALVIGLGYWFIRHKRYQDQASGQRLPSPSMQQYIVNTHMPPPSLNASTLASPAIHTNSSVFGSARSIGQSNV